MREALKRDSEEDDREQRMLEDVSTLESRLDSEDTRGRALLDLRQRWRELSEAAKKPEDSTGRRVARRVLATLSASVSSTDPEYLRIISEYRTGRRR